MRVLSSFKTKKYVIPFAKQLHKFMVTLPKPVGSLGPECVWNTDVGLVSPV